ncbi:hypothetical protein H072_7349 [Dactylellina haptotyla CBS 200.50]|uniref:DUF7587 domain-containing protein n=1 Tax=Dactylellina haptotyla (strain CBS 200.50) TaxID=1284197 RepID=S8ACR9_DACHA|nr:hypothetical protein H072_7349 [Dactylellina haptotyla CBS 200.50]
MSPNNFPDFSIHPSQCPYPLYRIHLQSHSSTVYEERNGFTCAADTGNINICNYTDMYGSLHNHLDWSSESPSHLISMFGTKSRAIRWARKYLVKNPGEEALIMEIDPFNITNSFGRRLPILRAGEIVKECPEFLPYWVEESYVNDEYLALYRIPGEAIMNVSPVLPWEFQIGGN